jgi:hypothetical protein
MRHLLATALLISLAGPDLAYAGEPVTTAFAQLGPIVVHGNEADNLLLGAGVFDIRDRTSAAGTIDLSYRRIYVTPQIAMGGYHDGDSANLGGVFQFRLSLDVAYRFDNGHRLGVRAAHISNAGVNEENPGEEELLLTYSISLGPYL